MKHFLIIIKRDENPKQQTLALSETTEGATYYAKGLYDVPHTTEVILQQVAIIETIKIEKDEKINSDSKESD